MKNTFTLSAIALSVALGLSGCGGLKSKKATKPVKPNEEIARTNEIENALTESDEAIKKF